MQDFTKFAAKAVGWVWLALMLAPAILLVLK